MAPRNKKWQTFRNIDEPQVLEGKDIPSLAKFIKSEQCARIILMLGAGVSTSAGIPDFRSPKTGLYSNLARLKLPYPEAVFDIGFFRKNPVPFYTLAHELYPGKFRPTITHSFIRLLEEKGLLHTCFTQNIDTLERRAGVSDEKIIEAHGSFASQRCIDCKTKFNDEAMKKHVEEKTIAKCKSCGGYIKPDIVFFGEALPPQFIRAIPHMEKADLLIVMGTSLTVHPFASLAEMPDEFCPRVLINLDPVGDIGSRSDDVIFLGKCDDVVHKLCRELGWEKELFQLWEKTKNSVETDGVEPAPGEAEIVEKPESEEERAKKVAEEEEEEQRRLKEEIEAVTAAIEQSLAMKKSISDEEEEKPKLEADTSSTAVDEEGEKLRLAVDTSLTPSDGEGEKPKSETFDSSTTDEILPDAKAPLSAQSSTPMTASAKEEDKAEGGKL